MNITKIEKIIGYTFCDKTLLQTALTHKSYANENGTESYERLEFLGDSILGFVTAGNLFSFFSDKDEGELSKTRAGIVCEESLYALALKLHLNEFVLLGVGEEKTNGRNKSSILSDCFESLIAAIYIDGGLQSAIDWVNRQIQTDDYYNFVYKDYKTILQEKFKHNSIEYRITQSDADFHATVYIDGKKCGQGSGLSKKIAEQGAAQDALNHKR